MTGTENEGLNKVPFSKFFQKRLRSLNGLDELGFEEWAFHPGMLFGGEYKWWGDQGKRNRPHEGLDLCLYRTKRGEIVHFTGETVVPVIFNGQVVKVDEDFLGQSLFVRHGVFGSDGSRLYTIYGHTQPGCGIRPGQKLSEGDIIGAVADTGRSHASMLPHLHVSVAWIPDAVSQQELDWQVLADPARAALLDPLHVIECPHSTIEHL